MTATIHARFRCAFPGFDLDVDLTLPGTGITALFGHSGCGKTTLLRCMAGPVSYTHLTLPTTPYV